MPLHLPSVGGAWFAGPYPVKAKADVERSRLTRPRGDRAPPIGQGEAGGNRSRRGPACTRITSKLVHSVTSRKTFLCGCTDWRCEVVGALLLGLVAGFIGRALVPHDVFAGMRGPKSWLVSIVLGLVGAALGWLIFTAGLGIGDEDVFDWGGILSALIGVVIVLLVAGWVMRRRASSTERGPQRHDTPGAPPST